MEEKEASISELCKQLGSGYRILTIDLERCIEISATVSTSKYPA